MPNLWRINYKYLHCPDDDEEPEKKANALCAFCGHMVDGAEEFNGFWRAKCSNCGAYGPPAMNAKRAIDAWNKRTEGKDNG